MAGHAPIEEVAKTPSLAETQSLAQSFAEAKDASEKPTSATQESGAAKAKATAFDRALEESLENKPMLPDAGFTPDRAHPREGEKRMWDAEKRFEMHEGHGRHPERRSGPAFDGERHVGVSSTGRFHSAGAMREQGNAMAQSYHDADGSMEFRTACWTDWSDWNDDECQGQTCGVGFRKTRYHDSIYGASHPGCPTNALTVWEDANCTHNGQSFDHCPDVAAENLRVALAGNFSNMATMYNDAKSAVELVLQRLQALEAAKNVVENKAELVDEAMLHAQKNLTEIKEASKAGMNAHFGTYHNEGNMSNGIRQRFIGMDNHSNTNSSWNASSGSSSNGGFGGGR